MFQTRQGQRDDAYREAELDEKLFPQFDQNELGKNEIMTGHDLVGSKNSNLPIFNDLQGDQKIARRPLAQLSLFDELETNAGDHLRFG